MEQGGEWRAFDLTLWGYHVVQFILFLLEQEYQNFLKWLCQCMPHTEWRFWCLLNISAKLFADVILRIPVILCVFGCIVLVWHICILCVFLKFWYWLFKKNVTGITTFLCETKSKPVRPSHNQRSLRQIRLGRTNLLLEILRKSGTYCTNKVEVDWLLLDAEMWFLIWLQYLPKKNYMCQKSLNIGIESILTHSYTVYRWYKTLKLVHS